MSKILIIGGVAGGATAAARLRRLDENTEIIMFEKGEYISFANCGLPYYIGGEIVDKSSLTLQTPKSFHARFNIDVRNFTEVTSIDRTAKKVTAVNQVTGKSYEESYDKLILSMGAEPIRPNIEGNNNPKVFTLRNIPDTYRIKNYIDENHPKSAAVIGGGYIGVEMAENLHRAGLQVTIIEMMNQVIAPIDYDMACEVHSHIRSKGVELILGKAVKAITDDGKEMTIMLDAGEIQADMVIMAIGVHPDTDIAKKAGVQINARGSITVNENMVTSDKDIYAVGDAVEVTDFITGQKAFIPLAGPANKQGRIAADHICGIDSKYAGTQGSSILRVFDMTVAATGTNEKNAIKNGLDYDKVFTYSASHASYYPNASNMSIKTIFEKKTGRILGVQIAGYDGVDKRCDVFATAIRFGAAAFDLCKLELCYAPPYSSAKDPVNMAGYVIENVLQGHVKNFHWHEVERLLDDPGAILLDTRTNAEYERGKMDGFQNIPLDELRQRMNELDKSKRIYVTCQIGLRGYAAARILAQNGYDVYNLSGGYRLYNLIYGDRIAPVSNIGLNPETQLPESKIR